jgi:hypothetical protein
VTHEYYQGPDVLERFKALMTRAFQSPKPKTPFAKPKKAKKAASGKDARIRVSRKPESGDD